MEGKCLSVLTEVTSSASSRIPADLTHPWVPPTLSGFWWNYRKAGWNYSELVNRYVLRTYTHIEQVYMHEKKIYYYFETSVVSSNDCTNDATTCRSNLCITQVLA